jgi:hypothetical protein
VASVTGRVTAPPTLLLGRYDEAGRLRFVARTAPLSATARHEVGGLLYPGGAEHPWQHRRFAVGWGSREMIDHRPVAPDVVVEFAGATAVDEGRYRHPVRLHARRWKPIVPVLARPSIGPRCPTASARPSPPRDRPEGAIISTTAPHRWAGEPVRVLDLTP